VIALAGERLGYGPADTAERPSDDHTSGVGRVVSPGN
jgi:hypothetical protein